MYHDESFSLEKPIFIWTFDATQLDWECTRVVTQQSFSQLKIDFLTKSDFLLGAITYLETIPNETFHAVC